MSLASPLHANLDFCQPRLTASRRPGFLRLSCAMNGASAVRIYTRIRGDDWRVLLEHCEAVTIDDYTPVETAGRDETREYRASAVVGDEEVGEPSEIITVDVSG